jgi:xanthine/CO dehydrogenase XdhC/CoxF family maturation factor
LQPVVSPDAAAGALRALLRGEEAFAVSTVVAESPPGGRALVIDARGIRAGSTGDRDLDRAIAARAEELLAGGASRCEEIRSTAVFTEVQSPPPRMLICGAGEDAVPLAACGASTGFRVTVADHRPTFLTSGRFPDAWQLILGRPEEGIDGAPLGPTTHAVVMTHSYELDREWLARLLRSNVPYIGVLGPRTRTETLLAEIEAPDDSRVFGPVGLDLGAEGPEQIALSIAAELLSFWSGRKAQPLRERDRGIHDG